MKKITKKLLSALLVAVMLLSAAPMSGIADFDWGSLFATKAAAESYTDGYYAYTVSDSSATISDVDTSISGDIEIPSTLGGYTVTSIGNTAFYGCSKLTSVAIPDSVTSIGSSAFYDCSSLKSITIPAGVKNIGSAFIGCSGLTSIRVDESNTVYDSRGNCNAIIETETNTLIQGCKNTVIPDSVTSIGNYAFKKCNGLTSIIIPNSVTSIGVYAFQYCTDLASITISDNVTSIGAWTFNNCKSLTSVTIPTGVTSIGSSAFQECNGLKSITIPDSVTSIEHGAFSECSYLTNVNYIGTIGEWCSINFADYTANPVNYSRNLYINGEDIGDITIPNDVTEIKQYAFYKCSNLTSITIPNSITRIGSKAFQFCNNLSDVYYTGSEEDWNKISISSYGNSSLTNATIHFNYDPNAPISITEGDINFEFANGAFGTEDDNKLSFTIKEIDNSSSEYSDFKLGIIDGEQYALFNISAMNAGQKIQPQNGNSVTVRIPIPEGVKKSDRVFVYHMMDNGKPERIKMSEGNVWFEGELLCFKTTSFSMFAVCVEPTVKSVSLGNVTMDYKSSKTLTPEITADDGAEYIVTSSSDSMNVTVDENGKIYAAKRGTANITVTVTDSQGNVVTDTCKVTVEYTWWQWIIKIVLFGWIWY